MQTLRYFPFLVYLLLAGAHAFGQEKEVVQVATRQIDRTFTYEEGFEVNIEGERAEVYFETWEREDIQVRLELSARHPDREIARQDLEKIRYLSERVKNKIYLRNYIDQKEGKPSSRIKAVYTVKVPADCPVYIKNQYGLVNASNLSNRLRLNTRFTQIGLENIQGMIDVDTRYGDLRAKELDGNIQIAALHSDLVLENMRGSYDINARYGKLELFATMDLLSLNLQTESSDVVFHNPFLKSFSYHLEARQADLIYPNDLPLRFSENSPELKRIDYQPTGEFYPSITVSITFGEIRIKR